MIDTILDLEDLERELHSQFGNRIRNLTLCLDGDEVVLRGTAPTYHLKQLAQHVVMSALGPGVICNQIDVASVTN